MNDPLHQLTPQIQADICAFIRSGGFPNVAAEAAGVPQKVFDRWMRHGRAERPVPVYREFYQAVCQAQAHARLRAENHAFEHATVTWLKSGPGKETARSPGWTSPVKPRPLPVPTPGMSMSQERLQAFISILLTALKPFPEARAAAADALDAAGWGNEPVGDPLPETMQQAAPVAAEKPLDRTEASATISAGVTGGSRGEVPGSPGDCPPAGIISGEQGAARVAPAAAEPVPEVKVFRPGGEPAAEPADRRGQAATNPHRTERKEQPASVEPAANPPRKEPSLAEVQREMYRNLLQSG